MESHEVPQKEKAGESLSRCSSRDDLVGVQVVESLLAKVESCKHKGNVEFQKGKAFVNHTAGKNFLADACVQYAEGLQALAKIDSHLSQLKKREGDRELSGIQGESVDFMAILFSQADAFRLALFLNLAACNLLLGEWGPTIACCTQVIDRFTETIAKATTVSKGGVESEVGPEAQTIEQTGVDTSSDNGDKQQRNMAAKALYRRSTALKETGELSAARDDLVLAQRLKPVDAHIRRELKKVDRLIANEEAMAKLRSETEEGRRKQQIQESTEPAEVKIEDFDGNRRVQSPRSSVPPPNKHGENVTGAEQGTGGGEEQPCSATGAQRGVDRESEGAAASNLPEQGAGDDEEELFPTLNGGHGRDGVYTWNQSVREVHASVKVPKWTHARNVRVNFHRLDLSVAVVLEPGTEAFGTAVTGQKDPASGARDPGQQRESIILSGALSRPIEVGECIWTLEKPGQVLLYLQKELSGDESPGSEWWPALMKGDPEIDVSACDAGSRLSEYPEHALRRGAKAFWEHQQKTPEEREAEELHEESLRQARQQIKEEAQERQRDLERALEDPAKAELYRKLKETMPDVPISIK